MCTKKTATDSHFITMTRLIIKKEFLLQKIYQRPFVTIFVFKKMFLKILSHFSNVGKKVHYNYYIKYFGLLFVRKWIDLTSPIGIVPKLRKAFFFTCRFISFSRMFDHIFCFIRMRYHIKARSTPYRSSLIFQSFL